MPGSPPSERIRRLFPVRSPQPSKRNSRGFRLVSEVVRNRRACSEPLLPGSCGQEQIRRIRAIFTRSSAPLKRSLAESICVSFTRILTATHSDSHLIAALALLDFLADATSEFLLNEALGTAWGGGQGLDPSVAPNAAAPGKKPVATIYCTKKCLPDDRSESETIA
jgi:hypothetical protein